MQRDIVCLPWDIRNKYKEMLITLAKKLGVTQKDVAFCPNHPSNPLNPQSGGGSDRFDFFAVAIIAAVLAFGAVGVGAYVISAVPDACTFSYVGSTSARVIDGITETPSGVVDLITQTCVKQSVATLWSGIIESEWANDFKSQGLIETGLSVIAIAITANTLKNKIANWLRQHFKGKSFVDVDVLNKIVNAHSESDSDDDFVDAQSDWSSDDPESSDGDFVGAQADWSSDDPESSDDDFVDAQDGTYFDKPQLKTAAQLKTAEHPEQVLLQSGPLGANRHVVDFQHPQPAQKPQRAIIYDVLPQLIAQQGFLRPPPYIVDQYPIGASAKVSESNLDRLTKAAMASALAVEGFVKGVVENPLDKSPDDRIAKAAKNLANAVKTMIKSAEPMTDEELNEKLKSELAAYNIKLNGLTPPGSEPNKLSYEYDNNSMAKYGETKELIRKQLVDRERKENMIQWLKKTIGNGKFSHVEISDNLVDSFKNGMGLLALVSIYGDRSSFEYSKLDPDRINENILLGILMANQDEFLKIPFLPYFPTIMSVSNISKLFRDISEDTFLDYLYEFPKAFLSERNNQDGAGRFY
jgi:hypothetical protein